MAALTPFATAFLDLPPELRTHILTYLAPDELGVLARSFPPCAGIESDGYLRAVWFHKVGEGGNEGAGGVPDTGCRCADYGVPCCLQSLGGLRTGDLRSALCDGNT
jgi:hypothetical protein